MNANLLEILPLAHQGYCCSQILMILTLQAQNHENDGLVRAMSGLCFGMADSGQVCGLLSGGAVVLGYLSGKGAANEQALTMHKAIINEYVLWFEDHIKSKHASTKCEDIVGLNQTASLHHCGELLLLCWQKILELCDSYAIDITILPHSGT